MRSFSKKAIRHSKSSKRSRSAGVRAIGYEQPTREELKAIAQGRRDYRRGDVVSLGHVESRPGVLAGEPVVKGTRIPARLIADLVRQGITRGKIRNEYELTREQIEAAVLFDRLTPRRARRPVRKVDVKTYFAQRARRASIPKALDILKRAGVGNPPMKGDERWPRRKPTRTK